MPNMVPTVKCDDKKILDFTLVQVWEVTNSKVMEKEGQKRYIEFLDGDG